MGLYYNPPPPHIGAAQPLEPKKLTPPSGPAPQNPPIGGGSRSRSDVLQSWALAAAAVAAVVVLPRVFVPPAAAASVPSELVQDAIYRSWFDSTSNSHYAALHVVREFAARMTPPVSGPTPDSPPLNGGAEVPQTVLNWWIPPPPAPQSSILLKPPQSGPTPDNPPFVGGAEVSQAVLNWWIPPPPLPQSTIVLQPPQSGPVAFVFPQRGIPDAVAAWWSRELVVVDLPVPSVPQVAPDSPPISGTLHALAEIAQSWIPAPPAPITARLLVPPQSGPAPQNPPFVGGAKIPASVLQWWIPPPPLPQLPEPFTTSVPAPDNPPFVGGAEIPASVLEWWRPSAPLPQLLIRGVPASPAAPAFIPPPVGVSVAISAWWSGAVSAPILPRPLTQGGPVAFTFPQRVPDAIYNAWLAPALRPQTATLLRPPQSGPVPQNPPFVGGARIPSTALRWWGEPGPQPQQARQLFAFRAAASVTLPVDPDRVVSVSAELRIVSADADSRTISADADSRIVTAETAPREV